MAANDNTDTNSNSSSSSNADVLGQLKSYPDAMRETTMQIKNNTNSLSEIQKELETITELLKGATSSSQGGYSRASQSTMRDRAKEARDEREFERQQRYNRRHGRTQSSNNFDYSTDWDHLAEDFFKGMGEGMRDTLTDSDIYKEFKKQTQQQLRDFAKQLGVPIKDTSNELGYQFSRLLISYAKSIGKSIGNIEIDPKLQHVLASAASFPYELASKGIKSVKDKINKFVSSDIKVPDFANTKLGSSLSKNFLSKNFVNKVGNSETYQIGQFKIESAIQKLQQGAQFVGSKAENFKPFIPNYDDLSQNIYNAGVDPRTSTLGGTLKNISGAFIRNAKSQYNSNASIFMQRHGLDAQTASTIKEGNESLGSDNSINDSEPNVSDDKQDENLDLLDYIRNIDSNVQAIAKVWEADATQATHKEEDIVFGKSKIAQKLFKDAGGDKLVKSAQSALVPAAGEVLGTFASGAGNAIVNSAGAGTAITSGLTAAGPALAGLAGAAATVVPPLLMAAAAAKALDLAVGLAKAALKPFTEAISSVKKAFGELGKGLKQAANSSFAQWQTTLEEDQKRLTADINSMVQQPFDILNKAAQEWYSAWDSNLKTITQTQGYTKSDLQNLMASYSQRLRDEHLTSVVSAADISNNLSKVLGAGLSGQIANEFAYEATILENAIPTQDFFSYASTYASIAANAVQQGKSQSQAIAEANSQLEQFASNILYANRELSGGFSTSLQNAESLFEDAVKIANSAHTNNSTQISGVLAAVSSAVGAVAPDLSSGIVQNVVNAAIGGNSNEYTALRSLAGVGASNTAFLQSLAQNPQGIFKELFTNLGNLQKMNNDNYMEVAESLAQTFGVSADAFARVDFKALAETIGDMKINTDSLQANMKTLSSGQSTTTAEQQKMAKINEMILNNGLSYVLDNEAARAIQQHMWDEELAQQMQKATYGVELRGSVLKFIEGISEAVNTLAKLTPLGWFSSAKNIVAATEDLSRRTSEIKEMLEAGKVGTGNQAVLAALTSQGGVVGKYLSSTIGTDIKNALGWLTAGGSGATSAAILAAKATLNNSGILPSATSGRNFNSSYNWGISKSMNTLLSSSASSAYTPGVAAASLNSSVYNANNDSPLTKFLSSITAATKLDFDNIANNTSYEEWKKSASRFGIKDLDTELSNANITEEQLKGTYEQAQAVAISQYEQQREQVENQFWSESLKYLTETYPTMTQTLIDDLEEFMRSFKEDWMETRWDQGWVSEQWQTAWLNDAWQTNWIDTSWKQDWLQTAWREWLDDKWTDGWMMSDSGWHWLVGPEGVLQRWFDKYKWSDWVGENGLWEEWLKGKGTWGDFWKNWQDEFITNKTYNTEITGSKYRTVSDKLKSVSRSEKEETGNYILQLAELMTEDNTNMKKALSDPTVQTNALLSKILLVLEAIMQAENTSGGATLATSLSALGLGVTNDSYAT